MNVQQVNAFIDGDNLEMQFNGMFLYYVTIILLAFIKTFKSKISLLFQIKNLGSQLSRNSNAAGIALDEMRTMTTRIDTLNAKISDLEGQNSRCV